MSCPVGVAGACAICAIPFPFPCKSMLRTVVGFVLAAILLNVLGYEDEDREGEGEGGMLGGIGRNEASSSASNALAGDHVDSRANDERPEDPPSSSSVWSLSLSLSSSRLLSI